MASPTASQAALIKTAIVAKAVRLLSRPGSPFGITGEGEWGFAIRPDYTSNEVLYSLRYKDLDVSEVTVEPEDVISAMGTLEQDWQGHDESLATAILAATEWVKEALEGFAIA